MDNLDHAAVIVAMGVVGLLLAVGGLMTGSLALGYTLVGLMAAMLIVGELGGPRNC